MAGKVRLFSPFPGSPVSGVNVLTRSAPKPVQSACKSTVFYYNPYNYLPCIQELTGITTAAMYRLNNRVLSSLRVIFTFSMRSSEYLQLTTKNVLSCDRVLVPGKKKSASYTIVCPGITEQVARTLSHPIHRSLSGCSYMELYRGCLRAGIVYLLEGRKNSVRTHYARQAFVREATNSFSNKELSDAMRHRSPDSITFYGAVREC